MENYIDIIENKKEELFQAIGDIVAIRSVAGEPEGNMPFGKGVQDALDHLLKKAVADGFEVKNVDNYGAHIDFRGETDDIVAMVGHIDIVPEGDTANWTGDPFKVEIRDGKMFGRGVLDDKGPLMIGYYAMKALRDAGFKPNKTIRIIIGCDEETAWSGMNYYLEREKAPVAGFSPDADFPAIYAEKGLIEYRLKKNIDNGEGFKGPMLESMTGGSVINAVADSAIAVISGVEPEYIKSIVDAYLQTHKCEIKLNINGTKSEIITKGVSSHAAQPELGVNAISILFDLLGSIEFGSLDVNDAISLYNEYIGFNVHGEKAGCAVEDEPSGKLSYNVGLVSINEKEFTLSIDSRCPVTIDVEDIYKGIYAFAAEHALEVEKLDYLAPLYKPVDDPLIKTLMDTYKDYTGDVDAKPLLIGGATYARAVPNTVAFGPVMPGADDVCHMPDEYMRVDDIVTSAKIFADALYKLAK